jgi:hypothetical protein
MLFWHAEFFVLKETGRSEAVSLWLLPAPLKSVIESRFLSSQVRHAN